MAVFTALQADDLVALAEAYSIGPALRAQGIHGGVENSNFLLFRKGHETPDWVLTLVEGESRTSAGIARLQDFLADQGLPVPRPLRGPEGALLTLIQGRPALLYPFVPGHHPHAPTPQHCQTIGAFLGRLHTTPWPEGLLIPNRRGREWIINSARQLAPGMSPEAREVLERELEFQFRTGPDDVQRCICHGDLFHDNALFRDGELLAVIDWHNVGEDQALYDLAIACTDWCRNQPGQLDSTRLGALLTGYRLGRVVTDAELARLPGLVRRAALRFWLSRLQAQLEQPPAEASITLKDPGDYLMLLQNLQRKPLTLETFL